MQELKFRNFTSTMAIFIAAVLLSAGAAYAPITGASLPVPLLVIGVFTGFLVLNFIFYPKATTIQTIQLTITGVFINIAVLVAAIAGIKYFLHGEIPINSDFIMQINPVIPLLSFVFSFVALITLARFENKTAASPKAPPKEEIKEAKPTETKPEVVSFEVREEPLPVRENPPEIQPEEETPVSLYEELYPQAKNEMKEVKAPEPEVFETDDTFIDLRELPNISLEEKHENKTEEKTEEESFDDLPTDIRLVESPASKDNESKGKIASIGKLLVNNRDIEGVIESGKINPESQTDGRTSIVSSDSGEQIGEKFNLIKKEYPHIQELSLVDKGGFVLASSSEDKTKIHITGALIAGAYHTLQNYLTQISFKTPEKIFFETGENLSFIAKAGKDFLFSVGNEEAKFVNYGELLSFIESEDIQESDFIPLVELGQINNFAASDETGTLLKLIPDNEQSQKQGVISAALFENLKVFLMNIQLLKLRRITVFSRKEIIVIQKFNNKIASLRMSTDSLVKISDSFAHLQEIYSDRNT